MENDSPDDFLALMSRVRRGDQLAAAQLASGHEAAVRRYIRFRLTSPTLRRTFDSLDICQSVLCKFFVDVTAGEYVLDDPRQLTALLLTMARNKLYDKIRHEQADCRDVRRSAADDRGMEVIADRGESPSAILAAREVLTAVTDQLTEDERYLMDRRLAGLGWDELALELGGTPDAIRKRMTRAIDRAAETLGLRES